jgi:hypothetical protein
VTSPTKECTCTPFSRCAEHLINAALDARDEADLALVERSAVSLADLYRKAKQKGVLTARSQYQ